MFNKQNIEVEKISDDAVLMAALSGLRPGQGFASQCTRMGQNLL